MNNYGSIKAIADHSQQHSKKNPRKSSGMDKIYNSCNLSLGLREPILGKHFRLPGSSVAEQHIDLNKHTKMSSSYTPVYSHLKIHEFSNIVMPSTPRAIRRIQNESYMDFYEPTIKREDTEDGQMKRESFKDKEFLLKPRKHSAAKGLVFLNGDKEKGKGK